MTVRKADANDEEVTGVRDVGRARRQATFAIFVKKVYQASVVERVSLVREGVPAFHLEELADAMQIAPERLQDILNLPKAAIRRERIHGLPLSPEQSERVLGLVCIIGQIAAMVKDSVDSKDFDAAQWAGEWLEQPIPALGGARPADYMDTLTGQMLVSSLFRQSQAGVFA